MKISKIKLFLILGLVLSFAIFPTCKRNKANEFSPFGPSSLSIILKLSASPNVITAGANRALTTIVASLQKYDSNPIAGKTVHFEIRDAAGNKLYIGYFEGNTSVASRTTDENGEARIVYYGPLGEELTDTGFVYIYARVAWDGKELIENLAPIRVVRDVEEIVIELAATPSALIADTYREVSTIKATVWQTGEKPLVKEPIIFEITDDTGTQLNLGYFEDSRTIYETKTNKNGIARVEYWGPIDQEISADTTVYIKAWLPGQSEAPSVSTPISIIRESKDLSLELYAIPNVLLVTDERPTSLIQAYLKKGSMPLPDRRIFFTISSGSGIFSNDNDNIVATTDEQGIATVTYVGPTQDEISGDQTVTIQGQAEASSSFVTGTTQIQLIRETTDYTLELAADPSILWVNDDEPTSEITATFKEGVNPLADRKVFFTITSGAGVFSNGLTSTFAYTNSQGIAAVTYVGPTRRDITADQTVTIQGQAEASGTTYSDTTQIQLIRETADYSLELVADPSILWVDDDEPTSEVTATFKEGSTPLADRKIFFTITTGAGEFSDGLTTTFAYTNSEGKATVTYVGPTQHEISADQTVTIRGKVETSSSITATVDIELIRAAPPLTLDVTATPNVLLCTATRPTSTITANLKEGDTPIAGRRIIFTLPDSLGQFSNGLLTMSVKTDSIGNATVIYSGPTKTELTASQTITVKAQVETTSPEDFVTATVTIQLILEE